MMPQNRTDDAARRRANFFRDPGNTAPLQVRAEHQLRSAITSLARSMHLPDLPRGDIDAMLVSAGPRLRSMTADQLASLDPSSDLLHAIAITAFGAAVTPDVAQRLRLDSLRASYGFPQE